MRLLSPVIASALVAAALLPGCGTAKKQAEKPGEPCTTQDYSPAEIFQQASPSIVVIKSGDSLGSGFVVKQDKRYTYILTNSHVVNRANEVAIKWADDREEKGKVISDHGGEPLQKDLALVRVDAIRGEPLLLKEQPPAVGEDVVVIGAPQGLEFSLSRGVMSQLRSKGDFLQVDAAVNPGNSGGPLFDKTGCVVGVVTFKSQESEGLNFAIAYEPTRHFLDNPAIERPVAKKPEPKAVETPEPAKPPGWVTYYVRQSSTWRNPPRKEIYQILTTSITKNGSVVSFRGREILDPPRDKSKAKMNRLLGLTSEGQRYLVDCAGFKVTAEGDFGPYTWFRSNDKWRHSSWDYSFEPDPSDGGEQARINIGNLYDAIFSFSCNA